MNLYVAYDVGSISVNRAIIDEKKNILEVLKYSRHYGEPIKIIESDLTYILSKYPKFKGAVSFTGVGGKGFANNLQLAFVNEIEAILHSAKVLHPDVRTVIDIGGQDSKFIDIDAGDYAMNELCAAGTGSFLDQQASRFGFSIEKFAELALKSKSPATIAGRCSVFAKSDMIHLQQEAAKDEDIALGLCYAVARNFRSGIVKGKEFKPPILFCGGVSFNMAMVKAFEDILKQNVIIPDHRASMGAIGSALSCLEQKKDSEVDISSILASVHDYLKDFKYNKETFKPLIIEKSILPDSTDKEYDFNGQKVDAYIGIDVGSISTNVVAIDQDRNLIAKCYLRTSGRPIEAVRKGIEIIGEKVGDKINVKACGTTGSGRYLIGDFVGADIVINEITAQATAAADIDPEVDTIFEIGGQDSKYISLKDGVIVDFEMNKICAAGTGSFLEEQSERFDIKIEDFGAKAVQAKNPLNLGERCTVFMETNVYSHYQKGANIEDILSGLAYSIAMNYINKVVERKNVGNKIFFQGAVAFNKSVVAAFEKYLNKKIVVPPNHEVTGAIGTAIAALKNAGSSSRFKGFEKISKIKYTQESFECNGCPNVCDIKRVSIEGEDKLFYGGRCEKYEKNKLKTQQSEDLFKEREELLLHSYKAAPKEGAKTIGIPYTLLTYEFFPFWNAFFSELGYQVILSDKTNKKIINDGLAAVISETCFPMKAALGHVSDLMQKGVDYIFLPIIRDMPCKENSIKKDRTGSYPCPYIQAFISLVKASLNIEASKILSPFINFSFQDYAKESQLRSLGAELSKDVKIIKKAIDSAYKAQNSFYTSIRQRGKQFLESLAPDEKAAVIVSRPYNSCDSSISMDVPKKLREIGMKVIPMDFLPVDDVDLSDDWKNLYWEFGERIISASALINSDPRLYPVYITNFGCGPDSFVLQYFGRQMNKPFLKIEVDEHTAGAGVITRCEAFADSLKNFKLKDAHAKPAKADEALFKKSDKRTIFIPYMGDGAYTLQSTFKSVGIDAKIMMADERTLELGRRHTLGKECYPFIITTGDMLKTLQDHDPKKVAFLMPLTYGPCRFGQYNKMQKIILSELGYSDIPIISPGAPESNQFYKEYDMQGSKGLRLYRTGLKAIIAVDFIDKMLRKVRPYEQNKGQAEQIYEKYLRQVCDFIEKNGQGDILKGLTKIVRESSIEFKKVPVSGEIKPIIGIVGEIFVRNHPFSNNEIARQVEAMGAEAKIPPFSEWIDHTTATRRLDIHIKRKDIYFKILKSLFSLNGNSRTDLKKLVPDYGRSINFFLMNRLFNVIVSRYKKAYIKAAAPFLGHKAETDIYSVWDNAEPYIIKWFGEAALSIGKSVDWIKNDVDGIINVMPFTCMPGTLVSAASKRIKEDYKIPWLNLAFDGLEQETTETRLEAFIYQAKQNRINKEKVKI